MDDEEESRKKKHTNTIEYLYYPHTVKHTDSNKFTLFYNRNNINNKWLQAIQLYKKYSHIIKYIKCTTSLYPDYQLFIYIHDSDSDSNNLLDIKKIICENMEDNKVL